MMSTEDRKRPPIDAALERNLTERAREEPAAFADLYDHYFPRIFAYVAHCVGTSEDAEDLVADTFVRALRDLNHFEHRGVGSLAAWLFQIARNVVNDFWRRKRSDHSLHLGDTLNLPDFRPAIDDSAIRNEEAAQIRDTLRTLSARRQEVIVLTFFAGLRNREIATVLGLDERTVASHLCRALDELRLKYPELAVSVDQRGTDAR